MYLKKKKWKKIVFICVPKMNETLTSLYLQDL